MLCLRLDVMFIAELMTSNLRACNAGIRPSNEFSTHTHFTPSFAQTALPTSTSKPCNCPVGDLLSNGGYAASMPKRKLPAVSALAAQVAPNSAAARQTESGSLRIMMDPGVVEFAKGGEVDQREAGAQPWRDGSPIAFLEHESILDSGNCKRFQKKYSRLDFKFRIEAMPAILAPTRRADP